MTRVVLVRDWTAPGAGGGCCGATGDAGELLGRPVDRDATSLGQPEAAGPGHVHADGWAVLYEALSEGVPDVRVEVVDSRNWLWLLPAVTRDARRAGAGRVRALLEAVRATTPSSVVLDGRVVVRGRRPDPDEVLALLGRDVTSCAGTATSSADRTPPPAPRTSGAPS